MTFREKIKAVAKPIDLFPNLPWYAKLYNRFYVWVTVKTWRFFH